MNNDNDYDYDNDCDHDYGRYNDGALSFPLSLTLSILRLLFCHYYQRCRYDCDHPQTYKVFPIMTMTSTMIVIMIAITFMLMFYVYAYAHIYDYDYDYDYVPAYVYDCGHGYDCGCDYEHILRGCHYQIYCPYPCIMRVIISLLSLLL